MKGIEREMTVIDIMSRESRFPVCFRVHKNDLTDHSMPQESPVLSKCGAFSSTVVKNKENKNTKAVLFPFLFHSFKYNKHLEKMIRLFFCCREI